MVEVIAGEHQQGTVDRQSVVEQPLANVPDSVKHPGIADMDPRAVLTACRHQGALRERQRPGNQPVGQAERIVAKRLKRADIPTAVGLLAKFWGRMADTDRPIVGFDNALKCGGVHHVSRFFGFFLVKRRFSIGAQAISADSGKFAMSIEAMTVSV